MNLSAALIRLRRGVTMEDDPAVPNFWVTVSMSPPTGRRDDIKKRIAPFGAILREDQLYQLPHRGDIGFVLIRVPDRNTDVPRMLRAIEGVQRVVELVDIDEASELYLSESGESSQAGSAT